ncbi:hypothetical protein C8R47DRAFT_1218533 [Mycena vitilis]|nr:hypothetical protein C8R47DRAFT_1218533 [Mycena vitilis]
MLTKILLFGATGYIGGSKVEACWRSFSPIPAVPHSRSLYLLETLLKRKSSRTSKGGDLNSDFDLVTALAKDADVVFSLADSTNIPAEKVILAGAEARFETTKKRTTYIHVAGVDLEILAADPSDSDEGELTYTTSLADR